MNSTAQKNTTTASSLLFIHAQTSLHPGSGTALGVVDLPVQRERHTRWPTIAGSALKGILRDAYRERRKPHYQNDRKKTNEEDPELVAIFGPGKTDESSAHAGALTVTDARILAFPVRSLRGVFAWVTCPAVLDRLQRDLALAGQGNEEVAKMVSPSVQKNKALVPQGSPLLVDQGRKIVLEEFDFERAGDCSGLADWIAQRAVADEATRQRMRSHLVVLHDDDFTHFVQHATEVVARIALDYERKTVRTGALFYQEFLPPETIFYSLLVARQSRRPPNATQSPAEQPDSTAPENASGTNEQRLSAAKILEHVRNCLAEVKVLQIGGDETTGKGLCAVRVV